MPVYLPITSISGHSLTVSGSYGSLAPSSSGTHFRIHAPPGVERTGPFFSGFEAGTLSRFTSASSSRNLFGGYRYESPLAGVRDDLWMAVQGRQSGKNFTGLHYTLHRHYDPHLMRFTSTDPAAAPFFNLYSYCGGNPAGGYDPDGLWMERNAGEMGGGGFGFGGFEVGSMTDLLNAGGAAFSMINEAQNQVASSLYGNPFETFKDRWDGTWEYGLEGYAFGKNHIEKVDAMWARKGRAPQSGADRFATLFAYKFGDTTGVLDMADAGEGRDTYTGEELGTFDRVTRFQRGGTKFASCALMVTGYANGKFNQMSASPFTRTCGPIRPTVPAPRRLTGSVNSSQVDALKSARMQAKFEMGRAVEARQLEVSGLTKTTQVYRPGLRQANSKLFKAVVGEAKWQNGVLKGTTPEAVQPGYFLEIKQGRSMLYSTYQIRLQTYYAVRTGRGLVIRTNRPISRSLAAYMKKWGGAVEPLK